MVWTHAHEDAAWLGRMSNSRIRFMLIKHTRVIHKSFKHTTFVIPAVYNTTIPLLVSVVMVLLLPGAFADRNADLEFAGALEETLGHFWAIELNLDERNAQLAVVHATHPIAELYDSMKPVIQDADPALDTRFQTVLLQLKDKATVSVSRAQAQQAVDDAKDLVETVRNAVIDSAVSADPNFKLLLMKGLLETSIAEYGEAVTDGLVTEAAEFQDGSAFVWRSQQIFNEIKSDIDQHEAEEIEELYGDLWDAYGQVASPDAVEALAGGIIHEIDGIAGTGEDEGDGLLDYVKAIRTLLTDAKSEYRQGNTDLALSYATRAYLDNYEFLEGPLVDAGEGELMAEVEILMREELRQMMRDGAPVSEVDEQIDLILIKMDTVERIVPEFSTVIMAVLASAVVALVAINMRSRLANRR